MSMPAQKPNSGFARRLLRYALPYRRWLLISLVLVLAVSGLIN